MEEKFEIIRYTDYYERHYGVYKVPVYRCRNCGSEDIEEIFGRCECHLCEDWGGCSDPIPLIARRCRNCGEREEIRNWKVSEI